MKAGSLASFFVALGSLLSIPLVGTIYVYLNHAGGTAHSLVTDLDRQLPFLPIFAVPYLSWYLFLIVSFVYLIRKHRQLYYRTLIQFVAGLLLCYATYAVYQTYVPRPQLEGSGLLVQLVRWVYNTDEPFNCFPSTHVLTSYLMMKAFLSSTSIPRLYTVLVTGMSTLIIASTQFMKQHVLLDIVGAVLVAEAVAYAVNRLKSPSRAATKVGTSRLVGTIGMTASASADRTASALQGGLRK